MKAVAALLGAGLVTAVAWLLWPKLSHVTEASPPSQPSAIAGRQVQEPMPASPVAPGDARSPSERAREALRASRIKFYQALRDWPSVVAGFGLGSDLDTLEVILTSDDDATLRALVDGLISPRAASYGFRRVLVHVRGLPGDPEDRRLIAEVTLTDAGRWITFRR